MLRAESIDPSILSTMDKVERELEKMSLSPIKHRGSMPEIPINLDTLTDSQLGNLHAEVLEYFNYVLYQYARLHSMKIEADNKLKYIVAGLKKRKLDWQTHPLYLETLKQQQYITQKTAMLEAYKTIMSKRLAVISRYIEIRKLEWDKSRRADFIERLSHRREL